MKNAIHLPILIKMTLKKKFIFLVENKEVYSSGEKHKEIRGNNSE